MKRPKSGASKGGRDITERKSAERGNQRDDHRASARAGNSRVAERRKILARAHKHEAGALPTSMIGRAPMRGRTVGRTGAMSCVILTGLGSCQ
jgi:hypothetical protein